MLSILDPRLEVVAISGHPGKRRLVVSYVLTLTEADVGGVGEAVERAVVRGQNLHDSPILPEPFEAEAERRESAPGAGRWSRQLSVEVNRVDLDVLRDWWRTGNGGEIEPIAEYPDHLVAEITIRFDGQLMASATTPVVTGSWGALGDD